MHSEEASDEGTDNLRPSDEEAGGANNAQIPTRIDQIIEHLPPDEQEEASVIIRQMMAGYSGPVPHAREMARYKEVDASFPERFVAIAERQSAHRQNLEKQVVEADFKLKRRGQDYAFGLTIACLISAGFFGWIDQPVVAGIIAGTTIVGIVSAFVIGRVVENKDSTTTEESEPE